VTADPKTAKTKAVLYARFSPRPNAAECESCESQLVDLRQYCAKRGYEVVGEYRDDALTGGDDWNDRPGMLDAVAACRRGYLFVVRAFDRLFRDTRKALMFAADIESRGVRIRSITEESASLDTPEARFMRGIFFLNAEYQRELIRARTRAKMLLHQSNGRRMSAAAKTPYGTMPDPANSSCIVPCPNEQDVIKLVRKLHKARGMGLREIARELERRGIERRGKKHWNHQLVKSILVRCGE